MASWGPSLRKIICAQVHEYIREQRWVETRSDTGEEGFHGHETFNIRGTVWNLPSWFSRMGGLDDRSMSTRVRPPKPIARSRKSLLCETSIRIGASPSMSYCVTISPRPPSVCSMHHTLQDKLRLSGQLHRNSLHPSDHPSLPWFKGGSRQIIRSSGTSWPLEERYFGLKCDPT